MTIRFIPNQKSLALAIRNVLTALNLQFAIVKPAAILILGTSNSIPCALLLTHKFAKVDFSADRGNNDVQ